VGQLVDVEGVHCRGAGGHLGGREERVGQQVRVPVTEKADEVGLDGIGVVGGRVSSEQSNALSPQSAWRLGSCYAAADQCCERMCDLGRLAWVGDAHSPPRWM
jgi:hypothetical protein